MSKYQYYKFRAIDRSLSKRELAQGFGCLHWASGRVQVQVQPTAATL